MRVTGLGANPKSLRTHNLALLMGLIAGPRTTSRVELAGRTRLSRATVSSLVGELIDAGLVRDIGPDPGALPGRPAGRLALHPNGPVAIGLQVAADHLAGCLMDLSGRLRARELRRIDATGHRPAELLRLARPLLRRLFDHATTAGQLVAGVAATVPGTVRTDPDGYPIVSWAPELGWREVDLLALLEAELRALDLHGIALTVAGEVALAALAQRRAAPETDWPGTLYVGGESVLGAVLLDEAGVYRGATGAAGDLGHLPVRRSGHPCECGRRGCLELYAGRRAMAVASGRQPDPSRLLAPAPQDDPKVVRDATDALAEGLLPALLLLDPATIVVGGRLAACGEPLRARLAERLRPHRIPVTLGELGPDAALRGAAGSVVERTIADPTPWLAG
jgi:predicted NBD/HSP70 family sugar kinase